MCWGTEGKEDVSERQSQKHLFSHVTNWRGEETQLSNELLFKNTDFSKRVKRHSHLGVNYFNEVTRPPEYN